MTSTNYYNTFIEVAEDCPTNRAEVPVPKQGKPTAASLQFEMISKNPYRLTSDDVIFTVYAKKNNIEDETAERKAFFSKGQPCLRSSPLPKRYGWGIHSNQEGKVAIYAIESKVYKKLANDAGVKHLKAMRSGRVQRGGSDGNRPDSLAKA